MTWMMICGMAFITFYNRYFFFIKRMPITLGPRGRRLLEYSMYAVLTALWVPIVFKVEAGLPVFESSAFLWGTLVAICLVLLRAPSILTVVASTVVFFSLHW